MLKLFEKLTKREKTSSRDATAPEIPGLQEIRPEVMPSESQPEIINDTLNRIQRDEEAERRREERTEEIKRIIH